MRRIIKGGGRGGEKKRDILRIPYTKEGEREGKGGGGRPERPWARKGEGGGRTHHDLCFAGKVGKKEKGKKDE